jgi:enoyl-CoA hydratase/carnithine racemase
MEDRIKVDLYEGVADVRLMRADKLNALDDAMFSALVATGERLKTQKGIRAVVLSGEGRAFCAGLDTRSFGEMASGTHRVNLERITGSNTVPARTPGGANRAQQAVMVWREIPVPVVAAVHGVAFGGGFQLCLGADMRFVTPDAQLSAMEIKWGLIPDMAGIVLMRRVVRDDVARELIFSGRIFNGQEASRLGLATRLCDDPRGEALAFAKEVAAKSPDAMRAAKRLFALAAEGHQHAILLAETDEQAKLIGSPNQVEAVRANLEKRAPQFVGRSAAGDRSRDNRPDNIWI